MKRTRDMTMANCMGEPPESNMRTIERPCWNVKAPQNKLSGEFRRASDARGPKVPALRGHQRWKPRLACRQAAAGVIAAAEAAAGPGDREQQGGEDASPEGPTRPNRGVDPQA